jgi:transcriptional regulator with GAF, ATPase, and Fis domain
MGMRDDDLQNRTTEVPKASRAIEAGPTPAELHVVHPTELAATIVLGEAKVTLGRQPDDDTAPPLLHTLVSRKHFAVEWDPARRLHTGVDLGSSNGSAVDGIPANVKLALRDGSVLRVGPVLLVYDAPAKFPATDPPEVSRDAIPGRAVAARQLREDVARVAADPSPVLLTGATGTGKELIAGEIHRLSGRTGKLVAVNCAVLNPQLVESQLFGHVRGAFTGASSEQQGLFRAAEGGTLLLDEIGELPVELQPKLLRVLQEKEVCPVGGTRNVSVDVRVIAATNRDLAALVESGGFRRDLYARLALWEIRVPSLQRRRADLMSWLERLHARWRTARGLAAQPLPALDTEAAEALLLRDWSDNLRGVDRLVHALAEAAGTGQTLALRDLPAWLWTDAAREAPAARADAAAAAPEPAPVAAPTAGTPPAPPIPSRDELAAVLAQNGGSIRATARHFARDRRQIYRWLEAFGLKGK